MYKIIGADGKEYGPITTDQLRQWIAEGRANAQTKVLPEGAAEWKSLAEIPALAALLAATPVAAPVPAPLPTLAPRRTNAMAVVGMVMGILSIMLVCCCHGLPFNLLGIIFSVVALSQIKQDPVNQQGKGMAIAGLILSLLSVLLSIILLLLGVAISSSDLLRKLQQQ